MEMVKLNFINNKNKIRMTIIIIYCINHIIILDGIYYHYLEQLDIVEIKGI